MKFAVAQINSRIGDVPQNAEKVRRAIADAKSQQCDLVVCPELVLTGYPPRDLLDHSELVDANLQALESLAKLATRIVVCVGFVERNPRPTGKPFFNSVAILRDGKIADISRKQLLPTYDVFDDDRYFEPGQSTSFFTVGDKKIALLVCEDIWNSPGFVARPYIKTPLEDVRKGKADFIINLAASPFHIGKPDERNRLFRQVVAETGAGVIFCNAVGANDDLIFDGGSLGLSSNGQIFGVAPVFCEGVFVFDSESPIVVSESVWPESNEEWHFEALVFGVRDYFLKTGQQRAVLGLSGGIDSSVVAVILAKALGPENVMSLRLPSSFTADASNEDAAELASRLGIHCSVCPIESTRLAVESTLKPCFPMGLKPLTGENIQPRIRMTLLMAVANEWDALLINTSNKSEISAGFATLYGDSAGALSPLGDLVKGEVFALGRFINAKGELIPSRVFSRPPTAELKENQVDQDVLPPYGELDAVVRSYVEKGKLPGADSSVSLSSLTTFSRLHRSTEYKRRQFPPILRISSKAYGSGRRVPVAAVMPGL